MSKQRDAGDPAATDYVRPSLIRTEPKERPAPANEPPLEDDVTDDPPADPADNDAEADDEPMIEPSSSLADHLHRTRRHPVILFGIGASGKTTMLMSLIQALNRSGEVNVFLGDPILPDDDDQAEAIHEQAITFFERHAQRFVLGAPVPPTRATKPYFIPIDVVRTSDGRVVRLAVLEGKGEWYAPITGGKKGSMFKKFMQDLVDVLELYGESLSVVWVAPYSKGAGKGDYAQDSNLGLSGALDAYCKHRFAIAQDFHLFLLNKWDCHAEPRGDAPEFSVVTGDVVEELIEPLYRNAWPKYKALALPTRGRRFFMQYASGHIVGDRVLDPPARHRAAFDRYPRTVWNWLYGNATATEVGSEKSRRRETLFPDVLPIPLKPLTLLERISRFLLPN